MGKVGVAICRRDDRRAEVCKQADASVHRHRRAAVDDSELVHGLSGDCRVSACGLDESRVRRRARGVLRRDNCGIAFLRRFRNIRSADPNVQTTQTGIAARVGGDSDLQPGGKNHLAIRRGNRALVFYIWSHEHHASADIRAARRGNLRAFLNDDIAVLSAGCERRDRRVRGANFARRLRKCRKEKLRIRIAEQTARNKPFVDRQGRRDEGVQIDLRGAAEHNAVRIDHVNLPRRFDLSENLRRRAARVGDFVESDPLRLVRAAPVLIELQSRLLPDVERLPIEHGLRLCLEDCDVDPAVFGGLSGQRRATPERRVFTGLRSAELFRHASRHLQPAARQTIRDIWKQRAEFIRSLHRDGTRRVLHRTHRSNRLRRTRKRVLCIDTRRLRRRIYRPRRAFSAICPPAHRSTAAQDVASIRARDAEQH